MTVIIDNHTMWQNTWSVSCPAGLASHWGSLLYYLDEHPVIVVPTCPPEGWDAAAAAGWVLMPSDSGGPWLTLRKGRRYVHVGLADRMDADPMLGGEPAGVVSARLALWRKHVGTDYHTSPAVAAIASMRAVVRSQRRQPRWILQDRRTAEWWQPPGQIHDIRWAAPSLMGNVLAVHHYDLRSAYLAAAAAVQLPYQRLEHTGPDVTAYDRVGYYRARLPEDFAFFGEPDRQGCVWITHSTLATLAAIGRPVEVVDSYTTDDAGRILRQWAEKWRDAMTALPAARPAFKAGYAQALGGLLAVPRGTVYRPDWRHMIIDWVRASIIRRVYAVWRAREVWPTRIDVDSLYYGVDVAGALGIGDRIGNMAHKGIKLVEVTR